MKQHLYCRSGLSSTCRLNRIASCTTKRNQYSVEEKIRILCVVRTMVKENNITFAEAASAVTVDQSLISRWRKQEGAWGSVKRPDMLQVHSASRSVLLNIERDPIGFRRNLAQQGPSCESHRPDAKGPILVAQLRGKVGACSQDVDLPLYEKKSTCASHGDLTRHSVIQARLKVRHWISSLTFAQFSLMRTGIRTISTTWIRLRFRWRWSGSAPSTRLAHELSICAPPRRTRSV